MYDVVIIGSGPAGISASLYAKRRKLSVLIIAKDRGALGKTEKIENYYGFAHGITGKELYENGIKQAENLGIEIVQEEVVALTKEEKTIIQPKQDLQLESEEDFFEIETVNSKYQAKTVILATGTNRTIPNIKGIQEFEGKGISYCAICDAFFYRGKDVVVIGNGNYALHEVETLMSVVNSVTILTNGEQMIENRSIKVEIQEKKIREFRGDAKLQEIEFEDNTKQAIHGAFIAIGTASSCDLARKIGANIQNNQIVVDENMQTTVAGLYACGDCTGGLLQINKAVYEGAKAGLAVLK